MLGYPISHSLSPVLHRAAYAELGLDWTYDGYEVDSRGLLRFMEGMDADWVGLSLTMPLKMEAANLMDFVEPLAKLLGVVNTVLIGGEGANLQRVGANTDVYGVVAAFAESGVTRARTAVVLGGGATAVSAVAALGQMGCTRPLIAVRSRARAGAVWRACTAMGLSPSIIDIGNADEMRRAFRDTHAVVSTIPAEAGGELAESIGALKVRRHAALLDVVYSPLITPLGAAWESWGGSRVGGERMLLHQAAEQVRLMTGSEAPLEAMDTALARVLPSS